MAGPQDSPSFHQHAPVILLVILGIMMTIPTMMVYDPSYLAAQVEQVQAHFIVGALLIPVCLFLAVQTFGIPKINQVEPRIPPPILVQAITQNMTTSVALIIVIVLLLMMIPLRNVGQTSWQPPARNGWR